MEQDYILSHITLVAGAAVKPFDFTVIAVLAVVILLLLVSALLSASEVAYFSLTPGELSRLKSERKRRAAMALRLYNRPELLLSTIRAGYLTIIVAIVILSAFIVNSLFTFAGNRFTVLVIAAAALTLIILFFGEILPKVYSSRNHIRVACLMAYPLYFLEKAFIPVSSVIVMSAAFVRRKTRSVQPGPGIENLSDALFLSGDENREEEKILKGILKFGNINVSEIMCPRVDVTTIDIRAGFKTVIPKIIESGFSRIPVFSGSFDNVVGILYAKDVLPYTEYPDSFKWQALLRPPCFVPETKKINELLKEFQVRKIHMAIAIDEFGGTSGIITLEDILEEIVGEISDESDNDNPLYRKVDEDTYIFDGKILLNDLYKIINANGDPFGEIRGESETLAGLILEMTGEFPSRGRIINYGSFRFRIESVDKRRIKEIRVKTGVKDEGDKDS